MQYITQYNHTIEKNNLIIEAKERIIEELENGYDGYLCDLHNEIFNTDYEFVYTSEAKEMLNRYDVFEAIEEIKNYELDNFGTVNTDFSIPCNVANMLWYIIGETALWEFMENDDEVSEYWNSEIDDETREMIINHFKAAM